MNSMLQTIKDDQLIARKARDKVRASILTTLYSEAASIGLNDNKRESTDVETLAVVTKFLKNLKETMGSLDHNAPQFEAMEVESAIYEHYLPKQMDIDQLRTVVRKIIANQGTNMGAVMKDLKSLYGGEYDGKQASGVVKEEIALVL